MNPPSPGRIGRYELVEFLGGGMSHVYRAKDTTIGRTVAVKILTPEGCNDVETRDRFLQEARMAGNITHDNILNIYDYGEADGRPFLVMEFLQGQDLRTLIRDQQTGTVENKLRIALQIGRALEYIHAQKIIHRDIKPDNVRIMPTGLVKLMDFGIAKVEGLSRTQAGVVVGTPYYMAPEQVRGGEITTQVDIYAFGILLFELFAGVKPVKADDIVQIFHFILNEPVDVAPLRLAGTPDAVVALIARCTAKAPADRPQNFSVVIAEIEAMLRPGQLVSPTDAAVTAPFPVPDRRTQTIEQEIEKTGRPKWLMPAAGAFLLVVSIAMFFVLKPTATPAVPGMILIPAGRFLSGEERRPQNLPAFYIDRQEVSAADYLLFAAQTGRTPPDSLRAADPLFPASDVTFDDAAAYARWAGKRLPSFAEWERAARGTDGRKYPWGNDENFSRARIQVPDSGPWPVTQDSDKSPDGALNMAGNVSEWVDHSVAPSPRDLAQFEGMTPPASAAERWFTMRGGSYKSPAKAAEIPLFQSLPARFHSDALGFRCAKSLDANVH